MTNEERKAAVKAISDEHWNHHKRWMELHKRNDAIRPKCPSCHVNKEVAVVDGRWTCLRGKWDGQMTWLCNLPFPEDLENKDFMEVTEVGSSPDLENQSTVDPVIVRCD